jgi:hypothetical protein
MLLLRRYERLRMWCHSRLLRIPEVRAVLKDELTQLNTTLGLLAQEASTSTLEGQAQP